MNRHLATFLAVAMLGCASQSPTVVDSAPEPRPAFLTNEELNALFSKTMTMRFAGFGQSGTSIFAKDGSARADGGNWQEFGSWRIEGNRFCTRFPRAGSGCYNIQKTGNASYRLFTTDGRGTLTWEVVN